MFKGIDISEHNGKVNLVQAKAAGYTGVIIKTSEGVTYEDSCFNYNYAEALRSGMKIGFYHYLKETSAPEDQAVKFHSLIKDKKIDIVPFLDVEDNFKNNKAIDLVKRFISKWNSISNLPIGIYTGNYYANENLSYAELKKYKLWVANYNGRPFKTNTWGDTYAGFQYSEKGSVPGISGNVDLNEFNDDILISNGKKPYIVSNYLPNGYQGDNSFEGVDDTYIHKYTGPYNIYYRSNEKGIWFETQRIEESEVENLKKSLGSWFYAVQY